MDNIAVRVGHYLTAPQDIIFAVASALLYPTLFVEVGALLWLAFHAGGLAFEWYQRMNARRKFDVESTAAEMSKVTPADPAPLLEIFKRFYFGPIVGPLAQELLALGITQTRAVKLFADAERAAMRRLDQTRILVRLGPALGLMGTLIPISPALVGLAKGDTQTLSANLVVAFSTTVVGLLIGVGGYLISLARERMYAQDMADFEYVLERLGSGR